MADDTIVLFSTDHGEMMGDHGLSQKNVPFEASIRVPMLVRWPGLTRPGTTVDGIVSLLDFYPTLLDGLSLEQPVSAARLAGHSLIPALRDGHSPQDEFVIDYGYGKERWLCLRGPRYKYTYWLAEGFEELYDLAPIPARSTTSPAAPTARLRTM